MTSSTPTLNPVASARKPLHLITTRFLEGNEVFVGFSDGTAAIYAVEELEKLRPKPKHTLTESHGLDGQALRAGIS
jgi:hypothetical protein